jgi:ferredoxin
MDMFLRGQKIEIAELLPPVIDKIDKQTADKVVKTLRVKVPAAGPDARKCCFDDFEQTLAQEAVLEESRRCMSCGSGAEVLVDKCAACLTCLRVCPFDIPRVTDVARIDSALCQACGMCIADCPANAIIAKGWDVKELAARTAQTLAAMTGGKKIVAYVSGHHAPAAAWSATSEDSVPGVAEIYLPSMSRLSASELMQAFVNGSDAVFVVAGAIGADRYPTATQRIRKRVELAAAMLKEVGFDANRLVLVEVADQGRAAIRAALEKAAGEVA